MNINLLQRKGFVLISSWKFTFCCLFLIFILNCLFVVAYSNYASFALCVLTFRALHYKKGFTVFKGNILSLFALAGYLFYLALNNFTSVTTKADFQDVYAELSSANAAAAHLSSEGFGFYDESSASYSLMKINNMISKIDEYGYVAKADIEQYSQMQYMLIGEIMRVKMLLTNFYSSQATHVQHFVEYYAKEEAKSIFSIDNSILMKTNIKSDVGIIYMLDKYFEEISPVVNVQRAKYEFKDDYAISNSIDAKVLLAVSIFLLLIAISAINFYRSRPYECNYFLGHKS